MLTLEHHGSGVDLAIQGAPWEEVIRRKGDEGEQLITLCERIASEN